MSKKIFSVVILLAIPLPGYCWNNTGHMVNARLAWRKLNDEQRSLAIKILKKHPHYGEFLKADQPDGYSEDEWAFLRAATWPDWVRTHYKGEYHHATWHYINYPFVAPGSKIDPARHQPPMDEENIVRQLQFAIAKVKNGNQEDRAIYLCWILHLVGDIHQPLHTTALFSDTFPEGDRGGNLAYVVLRDGAKKTKLHPMWDGLLGNSTSASALGRVVKQVEDLPTKDQDVIKQSVENNKTVESWAKESFEIAKKSAYLEGRLPIGAEHEDAGKIAVAPADYVQKAGHVARVQVAKAGSRLAITIVDVLKY
jgi:S1/P1 Nuclease